MVSKILLLVAGAAVISTFASGAQPPQPPRIQADVFIFIFGIVPCNNGTSMKAGSPGFPNALVQLQCTDGAVAANATTDGRGWFDMAVKTTATLSSVGSGCDLVVATPLASCNATLPAVGTLESGLQLFISMVFIPGGFSYVVPSLN